MYIERPPPQSTSKYFHFLRAKSRRVFCYLPCLLNSNTVDKSSHSINMPKHMTSTEQHALLVNDIDNNSENDGESNIVKSLQIRRPPTTGNVLEHIESSNRHAIAHTARPRVSSGLPGVKAELGEIRSEFRSEFTRTTKDNISPHSKGFPASRFPSRVEEPPRSLSRTAQPARSARPDTRNGMQNTPMSQPTADLEINHLGRSLHLAHQYGLSTVRHQYESSPRGVPDQETSYLEWDEDSASTLSKVKRSLKLGQRKHNHIRSQSQVQNSTRTLQKNENATPRSVSAEAAARSGPKNSTREHSPVHAMFTTSEHASLPPKIRPASPWYDQQQRVLHTDANLSQASRSGLMQPFAYDHAWNNNFMTENTQQPHSDNFAAQVTRAAGTRQRDHKMAQPIHTPYPSRSVSQTYESINRLNRCQSPPAKSSPTSPRHIDYRHEDDPDELEGYPAREATPISPTSVTSTTTSRTATTTTSSTSRPRKLKALMQSLRERSSRRDLTK